jgi:cystathionine gamma-lyase
MSGPNLQNALDPEQKPLTDPLSPITRLLHHRTAKLEKGAPASLPIVASSTFVLPGDPDGAFFYGRNGNPTVQAVEAEVAILERAETVLFPSGMAAMAAMFHAVLRPGDTALVHADGYYNARALLEQFFVPMGVTVKTALTTEMSTTDFTGCKLVLIETPTNPGLDVCDITLVAARAHACGALLAADNTTATPLCQQPLDLGADIVIVADTKAMAGHGDVLAGHIASRNSDLIDAVRAYRRLGGAIVSPFDAYLLHRGLQTLELRVGRGNANALALAGLLQKHAAVGAVHYPGLPDHPGHLIARRQMQGFGPIVSFTLADRAVAEAFIAAHPLLVAATSFGGTHSSAECRVRWGDAVAPGFVRLACGIEPTADLLAATTQTLGALAHPV